MAITLLDSLEPTNRVLKRAQYEAFEFSLLDGDIRVRNESHQNPADHEYRVTVVVDGVPAACEVLLTQCMMVYVSTASPLRSDLKF